ncbi:hypothetical protein O181_058407 [Austropuccinia psidii MF-1]|uniref:Uncharacterized protein n=1 Tax=Austropuccinia psidii MF-1 TaxID=1389203 RepID=A0A9Q3EEL0_9BASI|nr:hypothetical protein [Austropuccinia psidii MF-1]
MEDSTASTSYQKPSRTFETLLKISEYDITSIPVVIYEQFPTNSSGNIPLSVQELVYGRKAAQVGTSSQIFDRENELLPSSKEALGPRKEEITSGGF